jgi:hypothetical protein
MNLNPQELHASYRDWWDEFNPMSIALMDGINRSRCFVPRFFTAPAGGNLTQNAITTANLYVNYVMEIPAGSFIWGIYNKSVHNFSVQITDMALSRTFFNTPIPDSLLIADPGSPNLFPAPYPVMSPGTFLFEFYSSIQTGGNLMYLTLGVAVPVDAILEYQ